MLIAGYIFSPMLLSVNFIMLQLRSQQKISFNFSGKDELLKDATRCVAAHDLAVTHQAKVTKSKEDPEGWAVTFVLSATKNSIGVERKASRQALTQSQNWWHDINCHQTHSEFIDLCVLTTKP